MLKRLFTVRNIVIVLAIVALYVISGLLGLKVPPPVVSLAAEPILHIGESITISNALLTTWVVMIVLIVLAFLATRRIPTDMSKAGNSDLVPSGLQNLFEMIVEALHNMTRSIAGRWTPRFFPFVATIFIFLLFANWSGLIPGVGSIGLLEHPHGEGMAGYAAQGAVLTATPVAGHEGYIVVPFLRAPSSDLNLTLALALITVVLTQYYGIKSQGAGYFKKFFDVSGFKQGALMGIIGIFVGVLELVGELSRLLSFSFRLFGNIFAGEVLLLVIGFLVPYIASLPFYGLEIFVGFIQAAVFMMLAIVFMSMATQGHGSHDAGHGEVHGGVQAVVGAPVSEAH